MNPTLVLGVIALGLIGLASGAYWLAGRWLDHEEQKQQRARLNRIMQAQEKREQEWLARVVEVQAQEKR